MRAQLRRFLLRLLGLLLRRVLPQQASSELRRILVIKPDHAGDLLLLTPALQSLRTAFPQAHITLLVGPWVANLLRGTPLVDCIQSCPFPGFTRQPATSLLQPYVLLCHLALLLQTERYDAALIARDDHWWGALLATLAGIPRRVGYAVPEVNPFLTQALPHDPQAHVAVQSLALVAALGGRSSTAPPTQLPLSHAAVAWAAAKLSAVEPQLPLIAIQPGAGGAAKLWSPPRWIAVGQALEAQGRRVVITGGPAENALVQSVADGLAAPFVICDAPTLQHLGALFAHCELVLGVDSGPLHVAVAVGVPTVALFGPGDVARFGPWGDAQRQRVIRSGLWCSPCGVLDHCPRGTAPSECMTTIGVGTVLAEIDGVLNRQA